MDPANACYMVLEPCFSNVVKYVMILFCYKAMPFSVVLFLTSWWSSDRLNVEDLFLMSNVAFNTSYSLLLAESLYMFDACDKWKIEIREQ